MHRPRSFNNGRRRPGLLSRGPPVRWERPQTWNPWAPSPNRPSFNVHHSAQFQENLTTPGFENVGRNITQLQDFRDGILFDSFTQGSGLPPEFLSPPIFQNPYSPPRSPNSFLYETQNPFVGGVENSHVPCDFNFQSPMVDLPILFHPTNGIAGPRPLLGMNRLSRPLKQGRPSRTFNKDRVLSHVNVDQIMGQVSNIPRDVPFVMLPAPETPKTLYHYTTLTNLNFILRDKILIPKAQQEGIILKTARFGKGIYFTEISPHARTDDILRNNYGAAKVVTSQAKRTEVCFEFLSEFLPRLVFCEDQSCFGSQSNDRERKIWMADVDTLSIKDMNGFYYVRELGGLGLPKSVTKRRWNN